MKLKIEKRRIVIRVDADKKIGMGHVYNILTILDNFPNDNITILMNKKKTLGNEKFKNKKIKVRFFNDQKESLSIINEINPHIIVNDILDTKINYMKKLKKRGYFIVNFEDVGDGGNLADLIFNPIYHIRSSSKKFFGEKYACVRKEFMIESKKRIKKDNTILITFGGSDPRNLTSRILRIMAKMSINSKIIVILGMAFSNKKEIRKIIQEMNMHDKVVLINDSRMMAKIINKVNFVITSNGRTVFEITSLNVPMIVISANKRESMHEFVKRKKIGIYLGLYSQVPDEKIKESIIKMNEKNIQKKFITKIKKYKLFDGLNRVTKKIESDYKIHKLKKLNHK